MKAYSCLSPVRIVNPYTKQELSVPCGKCKACRSNKASLWVEKLERERASHPFSIFFTLTYSDKFVKRARLKGDVYYDFNKNELFNIKDFQSVLVDFSESDWQYLNKRRTILYPDFDLIPKFIKRLRSKLNEYEKDFRKRYLRYYITTEYGPTTLRPHHHGILFCDSLWFVENAERLLTAAWSTDGRCSCSERFGMVDVQPEPVSCSSYVAGYLNSFVSIPKVYQFKLFRPKCFLSKRPPLGSYFINKEEIEDIFFNQNPFHTVYRRKTNEFCDIPVESYVKSRLFPKIRLYDSFSHFERFELYRFVSQTKTDSFAAFCDYTARLFNFESYCNSNILSYLFLLSQSDTSLYRYWLACRRIYQNCLLFDVSLEVYLDYMDRFYFNEAMWNLRQKYELDEQLSTQYGSSCLLTFDPLYLKSLDKTAPFFTYPQRLTLLSFGINPDTFTPAELAYGSHLSYFEFASEIEVHYKKSIKTKQRNEYVRTQENNYIKSLIDTLYGR